MLKRLSGSSYVRAGIGSLFLRGSSLILALLSSVLLARALGAEQLGLYSFAFAVVTLAGLPVQMGIPTLVLREIARTNQSQDWPRMHAVLHWARRRILLASALVLPLVGLAAWLLHDEIPRGGLPAVQFGLVLVPIIALTQLRGAALRGLHKPVLGQLPESLVRPGGFLLLLALVWMYTKNVLSAEFVIGLQALAALSAFTIGAVFLQRAMPVGVAHAPLDPEETHGWNRAVWPLAMLSGMQLILQNIDILMLGFWRSAVEVGWYKIAVAAANVSLIGLTIVNLVLAPSFAQLHARGDLSRLARHAASGAAVALAAALPVALLLLFAGRPILTFFYGEEFLAAYEPMVILVAGQVVNAFYGSCVSLLNMSGNERDTLKGLVIATVINVVLNLMLIPAYGINGAALATLASVVTWNVLLGRSVRRVLGISSSPFALLVGRNP